MALDLSTVTSGSSEHDGELLASRADRRKRADEDSAILDRTVASAVRDVH